MRHLLAGGADALARLTRPSSLLVFDFDGTLAPIVWDHRRAAVRTATRKRLARLCAVYRCAVVSGREQQDVRGRLDGVPIHHVIGNHGAEVAAPPEWSTPIVAELAPHLTELEGVEIEDKRRGLAVHYRKAPHPLAVAREIQRAVEMLGSAVRCVHGKLVFDLLPAGAPDKGDAIRELRRQEAADHVLYIGDDTTDEDAFSLREPWLIGVRVGPSERSHAGYFVANQGEVDRMLDVLLALKGAVPQP